MYWWLVSSVIYFAVTKKTWTAKLKLKETRKIIRCIHTSYHCQQNKKSHAQGGRQVLPWAALQWVMEEDDGLQPEQRLEKKHDYVNIVLDFPTSYKMNIATTMCKWDSSLKNVIWNDRNCCYSTMYGHLLPSPPPPQVTPRTSPTLQGYARGRDGNSWNWTIHNCFVIKKCQAISFYLHIHLCRKLHEAFRWTVSLVANIGKYKL